MALVICNAGELHLLSLMIKSALSVDESFSLHLFRNNITPDDSSVVDDFVEADFTNYTSITLDRDTWGTPTTIAGVAKTTFPQQTWTCGVTVNTLYGAYVLNGSGSLLWADLFDTPTVLADGDVIQYTPVFTFASAN